jgi:hypothetical protein
VPVPVIASLAWIASVSPAPVQRVVHRREDLVDGDLAVVVGVPCEAGVDIRVPQSNIHHCQLVVGRLRTLGLRRLTLDFDGSVLSTSRHAEGSAVGFNKQKKGARSYYPLFCTVAQVGQVFDVLHRPGNVHDSHDAQQFIRDCVQRLRCALPGVRLEARLDSAFFSQEILRLLDTAGVEFTISVPFERLAALKTLVERRRHWWPFTRHWAYFEQRWQPKSWAAPARFVCLRQRVVQQHKGPLQLDLFVPHQLGYEFTVLVTNKRTWVRHVVAFHHGRGAQEKLFGELKTHAQLDYVPATTCVGNQLFLWSAVLAHNLARELQMAAAPLLFAAFSMPRKAFPTRKPRVFLQLGR